MVLGVMEALAPVEREAVGVTEPVGVGEAEAVVVGVKDTEGV